MQNAGTSKRRRFDVRFTRLVLAGLMSPGPGIFISRVDFRVRTKPTAPSLSLHSPQNFEIAFKGPERERGAISLETTIDDRSTQRSIYRSSITEERTMNEGEEVLSMNEEEGSMNEEEDLVIFVCWVVFGVQSLDALQLVSPVPCEPCESVVSSVPKMEQQFDNLDDVFKFYNNYAKQVGFSVRIHSSKVKDGEIIRNEYVCYKQGKRAPKSSENSEAPTIRRRGIIRTDCRAKLSVVRNNTGEGFVVIQFLEAHNHELTSPRRVHLLPSHRRMSAAARSLTKDLAAPDHVLCCHFAD
ncbi:hypothetical protein RHMOL_Rhmol01G0111400 [Rhododendron molle]|uniref:Uncharacterized protein n=1 Tax=Rhododendron molle TaxID=49168 RepID=A0ACC0Q228_RHOML|nr:hypothetical protein RHMOL_Rhmol01G0111400 [Rhododendron molle]